MSRYLCGDFAQNCFTDDERAMLTPDDTFGLFFLASDADLKNKAYGFTSNESRKAWGTPYALANGLFKYGSQRGGHSPYPPTPATRGASSPRASWGASTSSRWTRECGPRAICL